MQVEGNAIESKRELGSARVLMTSVYSFSAYGSVQSKGRGGVECGTTCTCNQFGAASLQICRCKPCSQLYPCLGWAQEMPAQSGGEEVPGHWQQGVCVGVSVLPATQLPQLCETPTVTFWIQLPPGRECGC